MSSLLSPDFKLCYGLWLYLDRVDGIATNIDVKEKSYKYDSELVSLYIKEGEQNKGIGTALFLETAKELISRNKRNMILWVLADNTRAVNFYKNLGGIISETRQAKIGNKKYKEFGFYFDLESMDKDGSF